MKPGRIHIGTSGWHYPHWVGPFYLQHTPSQDFLAYYTQHFQTVEINNTFYHLPAHETIADWHDKTPRDFLFACKASRFITHMKKLKDPEQSIQRFFESIDVLGSKLGPILFQLPPRWKVNVERLDMFLRALPIRHRYAFEFRDESWFLPAIDEVLAKHNAAFCLYQLAGRNSPEKVTADFVYIRLHGPNGPYQGQYDIRMLRTWAKKCLNWSETGQDVYCYFDNDQHGYAAQDAMKLKNMSEK